MCSHNTPRLQLMLDRLPIECVALIVRNSPLRTLLHCTATCQACHAVASLDDVWRDLFHRTYGEQAATEWCAAQTERLGQPW